LIALVFAAASCTASKPTQIVISIATDLAVPAELDSLVLTVMQSDQTVRELPYDLAPSARGHLTLPATIALNAGKDPAQPVLIRVLGKRGSAEVVKREARLSFVRERILHLPMNLLRSCAYRAVPCGADETCTERGCAAVSVAAEKLREYSADAALAPLDASPFDASPGDSRPHADGLARDLPAPDRARPDISLADAAPRDGAPPDRTTPPDAAPSDKNTPPDAAPSDKSTPPDACVPACAGRCAGADNGCGGTCASNDCIGCCDASHNCLPGTALLACGAAGVACASCTGPQDVCAYGACICQPLCICKWTPDGCGGTCPTGLECTKSNVHCDPNQGMCVCNPGFSACQGTPEGWGCNCDPLSHCEGTTCVPN
jgi:hypothetical protein